MSLRVFLDELHVWTNRLSKADCLSHCGWASFKPLKAWIEQQAEEGAFCSLCLSLSWDINILLPWDSGLDWHLLSPAAYWLQILDVSASIINHQLLIINLFTYKHTYIYITYIHTHSIDSVYLENPNIPIYWAMDQQLYMRNLYLFSTLSGIALCKKFFKRAPGNKKQGKPEREQLSGTEGGKAVPRKGPWAQAKKKLSLTTGCHLHIRFANT